MESLSPEQTLEIARRVDETFDTAERWHRGSWGRDDDGYPLSFDGGFHVKDQNGNRHTPALRMRLPDAQRCFCLAAAIRIHTAAVAGCDPASPGGHLERICQIYISVGRLHDYRRRRNAIEPYLDALIEWNDRPDRTFREIRALARAVVERLDSARFGPA